jgi:cytochrome c-type biogenesis protein CcmH/NrfG
VPQPLVQTPSSRLIGVVGAFLLLHLLAIWGPLPALWSLDLLAYAPRWQALLFAFGGGVLLVPSARRITLALLGRLPIVLDPWASPWARVLWATLAAAVFVLLRSQVHLLGDGYLMLRELAMLATRSGNEPLALWYLEQLYRGGAALGLGAEAVFRGYSYGAGFIYVLLVFPVADELADNEGARRLLSLALLSAGYLQLFCGYIETYPLLFAGVLGYILLGLRSLKKGGNLGLVAGYLAMLTTYHYIAFMLSPSLLLLVWAARHREVSWGRLIGHLSLACALGMAVLYALGVNPFSYTGDLRASHFLPLSGPLGYTQAYTLFSLQHLLDLFNEYMLVVPVVALAIVGCRIYGAVNNTIHLFLALSALGPLFFVFCANPEIGFFRDWDILAVPALPLLLWVLCCVRTEEIGAEGILLLIGGAGLHVLPWLALNASAPSALARYEILMHKAPLSQHARSYGWETLGSYYRGVGERQLAQSAFAEAVVASPYNARHRQALAGEYLALIMDKQALLTLREGLLHDPKNAAMWDMLGAAHGALAAWESSVVAHSRAVKIDAGNASLWYHLGNAQLQADRASEAVGSFRRALQIDARRGEIFFNLAIALEREGDQEAIEAYKAAGERGYILAHFNLALFYAHMEQWESAVHSAQRFLALESEGERAEGLRRLLNSLGPKK